MRRIWWAVAVAVAVLAGCGIQPSGVSGGERAPTGVAPGVMLYFLDAHGELRPQLRRTERLGTISEAMALLLSGPGGFAPGDADLHTEIATAGTTRVMVTTTPGVIQLWVPLTIQDVTPLGMDQIVCTALGVHVQSGGSMSVKVQIRFTQPTEESDRQRTCPADQVTL